MDETELTHADYVIAGGALIFLVSVLLPWFGVANYSENGLDHFVTGIVPLLLVAAVVTLVVLDERTSVDLPDLPVPLGLVELVASGLATLLVLVKLAFGSSYQVFVGNEFIEADLDPRIGIFLAVLSAAAVTVGVLMKVAEDGFEQLKPGSGSNPFPPNP